tara:strand:- start:945 stop:1730 length:786 start_codon:yes stop_codon:yes gene_type:complete
MSQIAELVGGRRLVHEAVTEKRWVSRSGPGGYVTLFNDFLRDAGATAHLPWTLSEAGGTDATIAFIDSADGVIRMAHQGTGEAQSVAVTTAGLGVIPPTQGPIFEARVKITLNTDTYFDTSSVYEVIVGMATVGSAVSVSAGAFDGFADNVGFRLGGGTTAANNIYMESDDGTTDNDDKDSGLDFTSGTWHVYKIDMTNIDDVRFYVDDKPANNGNTFNMEQIAATDFLEPFIMFCRTSASGAERTHTMDLDYVNVSWKRT